MQQERLSYPNHLNLGIFLPGHFAQAILVLQAKKEAMFLNLTLSNKAIKNGFVIAKENAKEVQCNIKVVLKPNKKTNFVVLADLRQTTKSQSYNGELFIQENQTIYQIKLQYRVQIPRIVSKKMLYNPETKAKMMRLIINKATTNDLKIFLSNIEDYDLNLEVNLLHKPTIADKENPYMLAIHNSKIKVKAKSDFFVFLRLSTNIGYKKDPMGLKKVIFRNVLVINTNSTLLWAIPIEIIVTYHKQPEIKEE